MKWQDKPSGWIQEGFWRHKDAKLGVKMTKKMIILQFWNFLRKFLRKLSSSTSEVYILWTRPTKSKNIKNAFWELKYTQTMICTIVEHVQVHGASLR